MHKPEKTNLETDGATIPSLWVCTPVIGAVSEIWIDRQLENFRHFDVEVLAWQDWRNQEGNSGLVVHQMPHHPHPSRRDEAGVRKWIGRIARMPHGNFLAASSSEVSLVEELAKRRHPSVMLCHFGYSALRMLPIAKRLGVPIVAHFHGGDLSSALRNRWYRWSLATHLSAFDCIVAVGSKQKNWLIDRGVDPNKLNLIPCGAPVDEFIRRTPYSHNPVRFVSVSRLSRQKGVHINIEAFAKIAELLPEARMTVVGDGPERNGLEALASRLGIEARLDFVGNLPPDKVREQLERSTVFLQHSLDFQGWYEGFGVSLTEAMVMELPVIVSACGGLMDQVVDGENGLVCSQGDVEAVAAAMLRLSKDKELALKLGASGRRSSKKNFDAKVQIAKLERLLLDLANQNKV